jgi:hypothetical protein
MPRPWNYSRDLKVLHREEKWGADISRYGDRKSLASEFSVGIAFPVGGFAMSRHDPRLAGNASFNEKLQQAIAAQRSISYQSNRIRLKVWLGVVWDKRRFQERVVAQGGGIPGRQLAPSSDKRVESFHLLDADRRLQIGREAGQPNRNLSRPLGQETTDMFSPSHERSGRDRFR